EEAESRPGIEPTVGVVDVREGLVQLPRVPEVLRVRAIRPGHRPEVVRALPEVRPFRHRNLGFPEGAFCQGNVPVDEGAEIHCFGISARKTKTLSTRDSLATRMLLPRSSRADAPC